jgi:hypothetical protein
MHRQRSVHHRQQFSPVCGRFRLLFLALGHLAGATLNALANYQRPFLLDGSGRVVGGNNGAIAVAGQIVKTKRLVDASLACVCMNDDNEHASLCE